MNDAVFVLYVTTVKEQTYSVVDVFNFTNLVTTHITLLKMQIYLAREYTNVVYDTKLPCSVSISEVVNATDSGLLLGLNPGPEMQV